MGIIRWARRLVFLALTTLGITMIAVVMATYWVMDRFSAERDFDKKLDVVVVLGAGLEPDGLLTFASRRRIRTGVWLLQNGKTDRLILSGGQIAEDVNISTYMRDFAIEIGATEANIELEDQSRTTWENLRFSYSLLDRPEYQRVGVLTDASHLPRTLATSRFALARTKCSARQRCTRRGF